MWWSCKKPEPVVSVFDALIEPPKKYHAGSRLGTGYDPEQVMTEGRPRAREIFRQLRRGRWIDRARPALGTAHYIETLDVLGIYGEQIERLHDVICHGNVVETAAVLVLSQMNILSKDEIRSAVNEPAQHNLDAAQCLSRLQRMFPEFGKYPPPDYRR